MIKKSKKIVDDYLNSIGFKKRDSPDTFEIIAKNYSKAYSNYINNTCNNFYEGLIDTRIFYTRIAPVYLLLQSRAYDSIEKRMNFLIEKGLINEDDNILDVGCGSGTYEGLLSRLTKRGYVIGVDFSRNMVTEAKKLTKKLELKNVDLYVSDVTNLPFRDNLFDVTICMNILEETDPTKAFKEVVRTVKKKGEIVIGEQSSQSDPFSTEPKRTKLLKNFGVRKTMSSSFSYDMGFGEVMARDIIIVGEKM